jgi:hypothetical protein
MIKYQNYKHYKLPITMNPLEYGKLIIQIEKLFVIQINRTNIVLLNEFKEYNHVKLFNLGDFIFEYKDFKNDENSFVRKINNKDFSFINNELKQISSNLK